MPHTIEADLARKGVFYQPSTVPRKRGDGGEGDFGGTKKKVPQDGEFYHPAGGISDPEKRGDLATLDHKILVPMGKKETSSSCSRNETTGERRVLSHPFQGRRKNLIGPLPGSFFSLHRGGNPTSKEGKRGTREYSRGFRGESLLSSSGDQGKNGPASLLPSLKSREWDDSKKRKENRSPRAGPTPTRET